MDPEKNPVGEFYQEPDGAWEDAEPDPDAGDRSLLERVVQETLQASSLESLQLIQAVAKRSRFRDTTDPASVVEVVRAIVDRRFGVGKIGQSLVRRVAHSLVESPEACVRLERIWQEARNSG